MSKARRRVGVSEARGDASEARSGRREARGGRREVRGGRRAARGDAWEARGEPELTDLWSAWQAESTDLLRVGDGADRLRSMGRSVDLSLSGPRMTTDGRRLLTLLGLLPDGIAWDDLEGVLPGARRGAARVLRRVGLAYDDGQFLRVLAPVREHLRRQHPPGEDDLVRALGEYLRKAAALADRVGWEGDAVRQLSLQVANYEAMIRLGLGRGASGASEAARGLATFNEFTGLGQGILDLLTLALGEARRAGDEETEANCTWSLGGAALALANYAEAERRYRAAAALYQTIGGRHGEGRSLLRLGTVALYRAEYEVAAGRYEEALPHFHSAGDVQGEADCLKGLGDVALYQREREDAAGRYAAALVLYRQVGAVLGEANCMLRLGDVALYGSAPKEASERYAAALPLYQKVRDMRGEAHCLRRLGEVLAQAGSSVEACTRLEAALTLYQRIPEPYSIGWTCLQMARLASDPAERGKRVATARAAWTRIGREDLVRSLVMEFGTG